FFATGWSKTQAAQVVSSLVKGASLSGCFHSPLRHLSPDPLHSCSWLGCCGGWQSAFGRGRAGDDGCGERPGHCQGSVHRPSDVRWMYAGLTWQCSAVLGNTSIVKTLSKPSQSLGKQTPKDRSATLHPPVQIRSENPMFSKKIAQCGGLATRLQTRGGQLVASGSR